jgi:site-specific recombinase XerC
MSASLGTPWEHDPLPKPPKQVYGPGMASIYERPKADGSITYQVKWREGGGRNAPGQTEKFDDPTAAETFKQLVNVHGQHWPPGWVRGHGFVEPDMSPNDVPLLEYAHRYADRLTGIDARTRKDYKRDIDKHFAGITHTRADGVTVPATICNVVQDDVTDWVRSQEDGEPDPEDPTKWLRAKARPKSIANRHGLLWCIFQAAVDAKPPLRAENPCAKTHLPRADDGIAEEMCFLEHDEWARIRREFTDPDAGDLAEFLVGTGLRWGEATALQTRDVNLREGTINIQRAWKRMEDNTFELGPPKTRKARRILVMSPDQMSMLRRHMAGQGPEQFVFRGGQGAAWRHSNYYQRKWVRALDAAVEKGLTKRPRLHDLRHTHVAWLIAANIPLPAIQARLGHESITTTIDRYGHLVRAMDGEISAAVQAALSIAIPAQDRHLEIVG